MDISVILCTYNRSANLPGCLDCLAQQDIGEDVNWNVILVDNNSSDDTRAVSEQLADELPIQIDYQFEARQGLSYARNRGIEHATAQWLIFIDDDIRVEPQWLRSIHRRFLDEQCDAVGGRILVQSPEQLPDWIQPEMYGFLGHRDFGDEAFQMDGRSQFPFGGNMAFQRDVFERIGLFDTRMGRKGEGRKADELFKGEETDYFHRLTDAGGRIFYEPDAIVCHLILPHQLEKKFFRTLHHTAGLQRASLDPQSYPRTLFHVPLFLYGQAARSTLKYLGQLLTQGPDAAFRQQMTTGYFYGLIRGYHRRNHTET